MAETERMKRIKALLAEDPSDAFLHYGLAMEYVSSGDDSTAVSTFRDLLSTNPNYVPTYLMLAQTLVRLDRENEARDVLRAGVTVAGQQQELHAQGELQTMLDSLE